MTTKLFYTKKYSLIKGIFFCVLFFSNHLVAQEDLAFKNHKLFTPLHDSYAVFTIEAKEFYYSSRPALVTLDIPYELKGGGGPTVSKTFNGHYLIPEENRHIEGRTVVGFEIGFENSLVINGKISISSDKTPYGKFGSDDFFQFGFHYNIGLVPSNYSPKNFAASTAGIKSCFIFYPGIYLLRRDKDYLTGIIDSIGSQNLFVNNHVLKNTKDKVGVTYATFDHLLRLEAGVWFLPPYKTANENAGNFDFRSITYRFGFGYDFLIWETQDSYFLPGGDGEFIKHYGNRNVKNWATTSGSGPSHHYDGFSCTLGIAIRFSG